MSMKTCPRCQNRKLYKVRRGKKRCSRCGYSEKENPWKHKFFSQNFSQPRKGESFFPFFSLNCLYEFKPKIGGLNLSKYHRNQNLLRYLASLYGIGHQGLCPSDDRASKKKSILGAEITSMDERGFGVILKGNWPPGAVLEEKDYHFI